MTKSIRVVGQKGQVVIPKDIRDKFGLVEGTGVTFEMRGGEVILKRSSTRKSSVDYFVATRGEKVRTRSEIAKLLDEEAVGRYIGH